MLSRRSDWHARLHDAVEQSKIITFSYGLHDCCLWVARCVDVMCDTRFCAAIRERFNYRDEASATEVLNAGGGLPALVEEFLGPPTNPKLAAPGDVVLARNGDGLPILGIVVGHNIVVAGQSGVIALPPSAAVLCWKV